MFPAAAALWPPARLWFPGLWRRPLPVFILRVRLRLRLLAQLSRRLRCTLWPLLLLLDVRARLHGRRGRRHLSAHLRLRLSLRRTRLWWRRLRAPSVLLRALLCLLSLRRGIGACGLSAR